MELKSSTMWKESSLLLYLRDSSLCLHSTGRFLADKLWNQSVKLPTGPPDFHGKLTTRLPLMSRRLVLTSEDGSLLTTGVEKDISTLSLNWLLEMLILFRKTTSSHKQLLLSEAHKDQPLLFQKKLFQTSESTLWVSLLLSTIIPKNRLNLFQRLMIWESENTTRSASALEIFLRVT